MKTKSSGSCSLHVSFLGELLVDELLSSGHHVLVLDSHNTTSPGLSDIDVVDVFAHEVGGELLDLHQVLSVDIGESNTGSGLKVNELSEGSLASDETEWGSLLSAESWKMNHHLDWIDVVGDDNELSLSFLNKGGHVVETELEKLWLVSLVGGLTSLQGFGSLLKTEGLLFSGLWGVLLEKLEEFGCY